MKGIFLILIIGMIAVVCLFVQREGFQHLWHSCLVVSVPRQKVDALIVLGGEPVARPREAARLYKEGVGRKVFVTGEGDAARNRQILITAGVPVSAITVEEKSTSTYSNALLLKPLLYKAQVKSALIVTSPFHTRRALATFRKVMPEINFGVTEASIGWWKRKEGQGDINRFAAVEFVKTLGYWLLYGVSPFYKERDF